MTVKNYSTPAYAPGKLVDESGQGSTNDSYGRTLPITAAEQVDMYLPSTTLPYGATRSNEVPFVRGADVLALGVGAALFFSGYSRALGVLAMGVAAADFFFRQASSNYDSAVSMIPFNVKVI